MLRKQGPFRAYERRGTVVRAVRKRVRMIEVEAEKVSRGLRCTIVSDDTFCCSSEITGGMGLTSIRTACKETLRVVSTTSNSI